MFIRPIPYRDPVAAFAAFVDAPFAALLDSATTGPQARFSYIAANPYRVIGATKNGATVDGRAVDCDPFAALERELQQHAIEKEDAPVPFAGGAVGFLGYELGGRLERLPAPRADAVNLPQMTVGFYDTVIAFDHVEQAAWIISRGADAKAHAEILGQKLAQVPMQLPVPDWTNRGEWRAELSRDDVEARIAKIIDYIHAGDIFQANFTQRFHSRRPQGLDDFMLYRRLREINPAPFASFMRCGESFSIASASPERFLRLDHDGAIEARPIKGTRRRDFDPTRDTLLARALQESAKDHAENLMIVDLMRNDLSRVSELGSVRVPQLCELESFASVHHLTSVVIGQLRKGLGPVDLLRASFPGGSVTGAPKIRAMEIIHELEPAPRGVYCGCMGWIGFDGAMDMSMAIRTMTIKDDQILAQAGGGIVADSNPAAEFDESMIKIAPLLRAVSGEKYDRMAERRSA